MLIAILQRRCMSQRDRTLRPNDFEQDDAERGARTRNRPAAKPVPDFSLVIHLEVWMFDVDSPVHIWMLSIEDVKDVKSSASMLTTRPRLTILRPSPTTISYTVSTASPCDTLPSRVAHAFLLLLRILLGVATSAIVLSKTFRSFSSYLPSVVSEAIEQWPWSHIGPLSFASFFLVFRRFHTGTKPVLP